MMQMSQVTQLDRQVIQAVYITGGMLSGRSATVMRKVHSQQDHDKLLASMNVIHNM